MKHLLFIPSSAHREALLGEGVGGATVPRAWMPRSDFGVPCGWSAAELVRLERDMDDGQFVREEVALVLVWRGEASVEGCDRLERVFLTAAGSTVEWILRRPDVADAGNLAKNAAKAGCGTIIEVEE